MCFCNSPFVPSVMENLSLLVFLACGLTEVERLIWDSFKTHAHPLFVVWHIWWGFKASTHGLERTRPPLQTPPLGWDGIHMLCFLPAHGWRYATYPTLGFSLGLCSQAPTTFGIQKSGECLSMWLSPFRLFLGSVCARGLLESCPPHHTAFSHPLLSLFLNRPGGVNASLKCPVVSCLDLCDTKCNHPYLIWYYKCTYHSKYAKGAGQSTRESRMILLSVSTALILTGTAWKPFLLPLNSHALD